MKKYAIFCFFLVLLPIAYAACVTPNENTEIKETAIFCSGVYDIDGINAANDNVLIDCNNSALRGNGIGYGILLKDRQNVSIKNCSISSYEIGIYLDNASYSIINGNYLTKNKFGIASFNSFSNNISNNILLENINDEIIYLQTSLILEKEPVEI